MRRRPVARCVEDRGDRLGAVRLYGGEGVIPVMVRLLASACWRLCTSYVLCG